MFCTKILTPFWTQWLAAYEVFLLSLMVGMNNGWTSPFIANLSGPSPSFKATEEQIAWVASLVNLTRTIGVIIGSLLTSLGGTKSTLHICGFNFLISWVCLVFANSINVVFISLVCNGISMGILLTIFPLFIGEIADPKIRGKLVTVSMQGRTMGNLFGSIMGAYLAPLVFAAINLIPSALFIASFSFTPDTPHYLMRNNRIEEATKAIQWYQRGVDASKEVESLSNYLAANPKIPFVESIRKLCNRKNIKSLLHLNVIYGMGQLTGMNAIPAYMEVLFKEAHIDVLAPSSLVILISVLSIVSCWLAFVVIDKFGRTTLYLSGCIAISVGLMGWGLNFHLLERGCDDPNLQWLTIISSVVWRVNIYLCIISTIPAMLAEFFAPDVKNIAVCFTNITISLFSFVSNKTFKLLVTYISHKCVFYGFSAISLVLGIYAKVLIPETKGKSLAEIQDMLDKDTSKQVDSTALNNINVSL